MSIFCKWILIVAALSMLPMHAYADENIAEYEKEQIANELQVDEEAIEVSDFKPCKSDPRDSCANKESRKETRKRIRLEVREQMRKEAEEPEEEIVLLCLFADYPPLAEKFCG